MIDHNFAQHGNITKVTVSSEDTDLHFTFIFRAHKVRNSNFFLNEEANNCVHY